MLEYGRKSWRETVEVFSTIYEPQAGEQSDVDQTISPCANRREHADAVVAPAIGVAALDGIGGN